MFRSYAKLLPSFSWLPWLLWTLLVWLPGSALAQLAFEEVGIDDEYGGNGAPGWVRAGDMDGDGDLDLVAGGGGALFVYENHGNPDTVSWTRHGDASDGLDSVGGMGSNGAVLLDVDEDGDLDVVSALYKSALGWWQNPGTLGSTPWPFHTLSNESRYLHDILLVDIDGDGTAREVVANLNEGYSNARITIRWFRPGSNPSALWESHTIEADRAEGEPHGHAGMDLADLDDDGNADLLYANGWYEAPSNPTGSWTWHPITTIYGISNTLAGDFDSDGDLDVVVSGGHHGQGVVWLENSGNPRLSQWSRHPVSAVSGDLDERWHYSPGADVLHHPECLQLHDLDLDGSVEIISCDLYFGDEPGEPSWFERAHDIHVYSSIDPTTWVKTTVAQDTWPSHLLQLVDLNQDGVVDIIAESAAAPYVTYYTNLPEPSAAALLAWGAAAVVALARLRQVG